MRDPELDDRNLLPQDIDSQWCHSEQRSPVYRSRLQYLEPHVTHALHQVHKFKQAKHIHISFSKTGSQKCFARQCTAPNNGSKSDKTETKDEKEPFKCQTNNSGIKRNKKVNHDKSSFWLTSTVIHTTL